MTSDLEKVYLQLMAYKYHRLISLLVCALIAPGLFFCSGGGKQKNLEAARKAYDRLSIGMNKKDACWRFGVTCDDESPDLNYQKDYGMSFSKDEYMVTIWVREGKLVRVELSEPYYEKGVRKSGQDMETVIAEKGLSREEID